MNGNLIFHSQSFTWEDLTIDRSDDVEKFISLTDYIIKKNDKIINNEEVWKLKLSWGYFSDLIFWRCHLSLAVSNTKAGFSKQTIFSTGRERAFKN
jgi:hypothetical protein